MFGLYFPPFFFFYLYKPCVVNFKTKFKICVHANVVFTSAPLGHAPASPGHCWPSVTPPVTVRDCDQSPTKNQIFSRGLRTFFCTFTPGTFYSSFGFCWFVTSVYHAVFRNRPKCNWCTVTPRLSGNTIFRNSQSCTGTISNR